MSEYKKIENAKAEIVYEVAPEKWAEAQERAFNKLARNVSIKGFRKGQAPKNLVRKAVPESEVMLDAVQAIAQGALEEALEEHKVDLIDRPELKIDKLTPEACTLLFELAVKPDVTLGDYQNLEYIVDTVKVTDEDVDERIKADLDRKADLDVKEDGEVADGDTAVIDYEGFKDGVAFEGGKDENHELVIGSHSFIPGFEEQLIGMKTGEEKDITVTFPEDYHAEDLKGAEAVFHVVLHEIKTKVLPELDDEFVKSLTIENVETVEQLKDHYRNSLLENKKNDAENKATSELLDKLNDIAEIDVPAVMVDHELDEQIERYSQQLQSQGLSLDMFLQVTNQTLDQLKESQRDAALRNVRMNLILDEIAKREELVPAEEDYEKEYQKWADMYEMKVEDIKAVLNKDVLKDDLTHRKVLDYLRRK